MRHKCNGSETNALGKKSFYVVAFVTVVTIQVVPKLATQLAYIMSDKFCIFSIRFYFKSILKI